MARPSVAPGFWRRKPLIQLALNAPEGDYPPGSFSADPEITELQIYLRRLPEAFDGLRIVHLSDIHLSMFSSVEEVRRVVDLANLLDPDLVALTGDYVTYSPLYIQPAAQALSGLRARMGVFAVLGNHDFRAGAAEVTRAFRNHHIGVLRNARVALTRSRSRGEVWLAGVDDPWTARADFARALRSIPSCDAKILLCHNPAAIGEAAGRGVDLMLSGHTHGGQVRLPLLRSLYRSVPGERFVDGWNYLGETQIYVNRGIGKVVLPLRVACPPEITCLCLRSDRSGFDPTASVPAPLQNANLCC